MRACTYLCLSLCSPMARLLCPWDSPGKITGVSGHFLLQGVFLTQGLNLCLLHCRQILYHECHLGSPGRTSRQKSLKVEKVWITWSTNPSNLLSLEHCTLPWRGTSYLTVSESLDSDFLDWFYSFLLFGFPLVASNLFERRKHQSRNEKQINGMGRYGFGRLKT